MEFPRVDASHVQREIPVDMPKDIPLEEVFLAPEQHATGGLAVPREQFPVERGRRGGNVRYGQPIDLYIIFLSAEQLPIAVDTELAVLAAGVGVGKQLPFGGRTRTLAEGTAHPRDIRFRQVQPRLLIPA